MYLFPNAAAPTGQDHSRAQTNLGRVVGATTVLFHEGDQAGALFEVVSGVFRATKVFPDGRRQVVGFAYPGDIIGLGHGASYRFDCDALTPARVEISTQGEMLAAVSVRPELASRLIAMAAAEIGAMHDLSVLLCRKSAMERIAGFLMSLARRTGKLANDERIALPMCRADIADHLGLTIETVSRNMTKLKVRGIVDLPSRGCFVIRDIERLTQLAESDPSVH